MKYFHRYKSLLLLSFIFFFFLFPSHVSAQSNCDSNDPRWNIGVFVKDTSGRIWARRSDSCVGSRTGVTLTRSGVANNWVDSAGNGITQRCENSDGFNQGGFDVRTFECPNLVGRRMIMDVGNLPSGYSCSTTTWHYENSSNGSILSTGTGCRIDVPVPPNDYSNRVIVTMGTSAAATPTPLPNLVDPPRVSQTCNANGTVTLRWNARAGAVEYAWRLNNRTNGWYTSSTDSYGYTTGLSVTMPIVGGVSHDWAITATRTAGVHPTASSWSTAFTCAIPAATPSPYVNIQAHNPQGALVSVRGMSYTYNCGSYPLCFLGSAEYVSSANLSAIGGWQGGGGIALRPNQRLLGITPAPAGGGQVDRTSSSNGAWQNGIRWNNYWWNPYLNTGSRSINFIVASVTPIPTATPPLSCGTITFPPGTAARVGTAFNANISGVSSTTTGCNLLFNGISQDTGVSAGNPRRCDMATTVDNGNVTYNVRATNGATSISCRTATFCGDSTPPPAPGTGAAPITCTYSGVNGVGARLYDVSYNFNAVADAGCLNALNSTPYWAQLSNSATANGAGNYNNAWNADNTWQAGAAGLTSSLTDIVEGTTIYAHAKSRDGLDNQSAWSANNARLLNPTNCTGVPTNTPTPTFTVTPTPTPLPVYWYKLKDASLNKKNTTNTKVPNSAVAYDPDDSNVGQLIVGQGGLITSNTVMTITNGGTFSPNQSYKSNYVVTDHYIQNVTTLNAFRDELIDTRKVKNVTTVAQIETDTVNIFPSGITINNNAVLPSGKYIIFVNGNVTINGAAAPLIFNSTNQSIAIIATGTIFIDESITEANGIFIAPQVVLSSTAATADQQPPLKINGNIISTNTVDTNQRQSADQNRPSFFVVFRPKMYFDLLPLLSTVVQEGRQLE